jgi:DNA polymerase III alpha subunit (gram-positive type)
MIAIRYCQREQTKTENRMEFIAQTEVVNYYREEEETVKIFTRSNNKLIQGGAMAENDLVENIINNSITKISESFAFDYVEILTNEIDSEATEDQKIILQAQIDNVNRLIN